MKKTPIFLLGIASTLVLGNLISSSVLGSKSVGEPKPTVLWTKRMKGAISDLSLSNNGKTILVATSRDPDIEGSDTHNLLSSWNSSGSSNWEIRVKSATKDIDLSEDGSLAVVSDYGNQISGLDEDGKRVWSVKGLCKPKVLNLSKRILCYHDDDAQPEVAFDILDWNGTKIYSYSIQSDVLALKISHDERNLAIGLTEGEFVLFDPQRMPLWKKKVEGEIIDLAVSSGENPKIAVLYKTKMKTQEVAVFDSQGVRQNTTQPSFRATQLEYEPQGTALFYYGNSPDGQFAARANLEGKATKVNPGKPSSELWKTGGPRAADFSGALQIVSNQIFMSYEDLTTPKRVSHLLMSDLNGTQIWDLPVPKDTGAYIYAYRIAPAAAAIAIGTDDGKLSFVHY